MLGELRRLKVEGNGAHGWAKAKMPRALWRPLSMAIGFLVVLTAIVATWRRDHTSERSAPPVSTASNQQSLKASAQPRQEYDRSAIAVLPFENLNKDQDNEAFASGLHHDLLTQISQISSLKVISRTSVMGYASGSARNIRQIAEELSVGTVLEGGVQRLGDRVRVNAQPIDARNDEHIWADTFDRELSVTNVFEIQSEIASQVARVLQTEIAWVALNDPLPTTNLEAYDFFVRGNEYYHRPGLPARGPGQCYRHVSASRGAGSDVRPRLGQPCAVACRSPVGSRRPLRARGAQDACTPGSPEGVGD